MGLFSRAFKAVGRAVGKGIEKVGECIGSETLQNIGQTIQYDCRKVSEETGKVDRYDKERARLEETQKINRILTDFSLELEKKADEIEKMAISQSDVYFKELIRVLTSSKSEIGINVGRIERTMNKVEREIKGNLKLYISKRVSIDDAECLEILKMGAGNAKEKEMKKFADKILQEGLSNLIRDVRFAIKEQNDIITDVIDEHLEDLKNNLGKQIKEFNLLENSKLKTEEEVNRLRDELIAKIQLSETCVDLLE